MEQLRVDPVNPEPASIQRAADVIRGRGLVAFPTETVYGLGADGLDGRAVLRVFQAKGRPAINPLILHVADRESARTVVRGWPAAAEALAMAFWPGPLTLILPKADHVPPVVTAGLPHVAVRVPDHPVALALLRAVQRPIVAPSANPSAAVSPTTADHVARGLGNRVDLILDAGETQLGIESTVVDLSVDPPRLLRPGSLDARRIERLTGTLARDTGDELHGPRPSPGMLRRHYAPSARVRLFGPEDRPRLEQEMHQRMQDPQGFRIGALLLRPLDAPLDHTILMPADAAAYARRLYAELHSLDARGCNVILIERVPTGSEWEGVRDRLTRAATPPDPTGT